MSAREANRLLNEYIADARRGVVVAHDHFVGRPHGGFAVFDVRTEGQLAALREDSSPLEGWELRVHPLTFSLTAVGFAAQVDFTLEQYGRTSLEALRAAEEDDPRYWWRKGVA